MAASLLSAPSSFINSLFLMNSFILTRFKMMVSQLTAVGDGSQLQQKNDLVLACLKVNGHKAKTKPSKQTDKELQHPYIVRMRPNLAQMSDPVTHMAVNPP